MNKVHINMTRTELRRTVTACSMRDVAMVLFIFSVWGDSMGMQAGYIRGVSWFCAAVSPLQFGREEHCRSHTVRFYRCHNAGSLRTLTLFRSVIAYWESIVS